jgi:hypothetical protein
MCQNRRGDNCCGGDEFEKHDAASLYAVHSDLAPHWRIEREESTRALCKPQTATE